MSLLAPPNDAPYTRHYLVDASREVNFAVYDDPKFGVTVITTVHSRGWRYPMTEVSPQMTREAARERYADALRQGLARRPSFRSAHYGPVVRG